MKIQSLSPIEKDLASLRVIQPCPKSWNEMKGSDQKRFCEHCSLHVHNLSAMTPRQIRGLTQTPGRHCVAYFEKADGHIRTRSRFAFLGRSFSRTHRLAASLLALIFPFSFIGCSPRNTSTLTPPPPTTQLPTSPKDTPMLMGKPAMPQPRSQPSQSKNTPPQPEPKPMRLGETSTPLPPPPSPTQPVSENTPPETRPMIMGMVAPGETK